MYTPTTAEIEAELAGLGASPADLGLLDMIVCRPGVGERQVMEQGRLDCVDGLLGDNWLARGSTGTPDGSAAPDAQIAIMNSRVMRALTRDRARWPLAGDQLFLDLDLSEENLPPGQRIAIGTSVLEITALPHTGCAQFTERFGHDAIRFVNSPEDRRLRRRGVYARVVQPGIIATGDRVSKLPVKG